MMSRICSPDHAEQRLKTGTISASMITVRLERVSVEFPIYDGNHRSLRHAFLKVTTGGRVAPGVGNRIVVQALQDVSFVLDEGDRVALIGHNGAGKTTLLRVLAGIYHPVSGTITSNGRIAPLFDVNLGMSPDATGWENIRIRALYLGMSTAEITQKIEEIAEFTELGQFLDMPLRTYSLGMQTRLAFAVSTAIEPEILLLDEGIGAGDASFIEKANRRLDDFVQRAGIMVLASHSMEINKRLCNKGIVMEHGRLQYFGPIDEAIAFYAGLIARGT